MELSDARQEWLRDEVIEVLSSGRWKNTNAVIDRVRKRWTWATDTDVIGAIEQMEEQGRLESKIKKALPGKGHVELETWEGLIRIGRSVDSP